MNASLEVVCYRSKTLKNGNHPLMLRVTKDRKIRYLSLSVSIHPQDWDFKKNQPKPNCPNKEYVEKLILAKKGAYQDKIIELSANQKDYTPESLVTLIENRVIPKTIHELYSEHIDSLLKAGRIGNAKVYKYSHRSLLKFTKNKLSIPASDITPEWLKKYEEWLRNSGCGNNTMNQLFRTLRSIYNQAISLGVVKSPDYPFKKYSIGRFSTTTPKRAIRKDEILKIKELDLSQTDFYTQFSRNIFLFSYLGAGINISDIAFLRPANISHEGMCYIRKKTGKKVHCRLSEEAIKIIEQYADWAAKEDYIFPILKREHNTPLKQNNRIHKVMGHVNRKLKIIGEMTQIKSLTTYVARHTYATVLKRSGVNIALISESLGHSELSTTQIYLDSFENEQIDEAMQNLL